MEVRKRTFTPDTGEPVEEKRDRFFKIRNVLNIIFMLAAIVGVATYLLASHTTGIIIVIVGMAFKFVECSLRLIR